MTSLLAEQLRELVDQNRRIKAKEALDQPYRIRRRKVYLLKMINPYKCKSTIKSKQVAIRFKVEIQVSTHLYSFKDNSLIDVRSRDPNSQHLVPIKILTQEALQTRKETQKRDNLCSKNPSLPKSLTSKVVVLMPIPHLQNLKKVRKTKGLFQITTQKKLS